MPVLKNFHWFTAFYKVLFYYTNTTSHRFWLNIYGIKLLESQITMFFLFFMIYKKSDLKGIQKRRKDNNISIQKSLFF